MTPVMTYDVSYNLCVFPVVCVSCSVCCLTLKHINNPPPLRLAPPKPLTPIVWFLEKRLPATSPAAYLALPWLNRCMEARPRVFRELIMRWAPWLSFLVRRRSSPRCSPLRRTSSSLTSASLLGAPRMTCGDHTRHRRLSAPGRHVVPGQHVHAGVLGCALPSR